ncbi:MAG TPA: acyl-CoA dehydrogenase family protein, partial [Sphingomonas sp.]|nr:acyl-CoA dehydrogenase family protein [Sphingomonas sp.]
MATLAEPATTSGLDLFRSQVREWLAANFPASLKGKDNTMSAVEGPGEETPEQAAWRKAMGEKGWGVPTWPAEYGGGGLSRAEARVLADEMAKIGAW